MIEAFEKQTVRQAEAKVIAEHPQGSLMKKAAGEVSDTTVEFLLARGAKVAETRILGLVGGGDNGGDCLYALSYLAKLGYPCLALIISDNPHEKALAAAKKAEVTIEQIDLTGNARQIARLAARRARVAQVWIDGLVGTGVNGKLREPLAQVATELTRLYESRRLKVLRVAIDIPSGIFTDDGRLPGPFLGADVTVTMGGRKSSSLLPPAAYQFGQVRLVDLGLQMKEPRLARLEAADVGTLWPVPGPEDHKYTRGVVQVVAGSAAFPLTGVLCVEGAGRAGAGMVRYVGPEDAAFAILSRFPEAVSGAGKHQCLLVGPGVDPKDSARVREALNQAVQAATSGIPLVLDAGAIDLYPQIISQIPGGTLTHRTILTPHAGEAARLLSTLGAGGGRGGVSRAEVEASPAAWVQYLADKTGATVLLKGAVTLIASAEGTMFSQAGAPYWTGTAGSGDVLAGIVGAVLAQHQARAEQTGHQLSPSQVSAAVASAAWVHARAARKAAGLPFSCSQPDSVNNLGAPVVATDIARQVPGAIVYALEQARAV
ncbi:bifunctional ADP-dependent NAD(P)H-hydrate dehydratase/NAD(P)H-hydrate epimerase [Varibaculum massiliense]|uniref:bifunctional ADP-dependent NAD(P)H-hydrate dehydratase/NAD(P)H-hydrate epimerase n=1 Tax=Varibaculum massiliense TaxID=1852372 RepID=UPI0008DB2533|nr:bifunctional ADP-dependent NAD(P)H-hydrate dehydratase/NAD(P)H-hydrate epimerase [Varibaculum massiliense]